MAGETPLCIRAGRGLPDDSANGYSREPFAADVSEGKNDPTFGNAPFLPHQCAALSDHAPYPALHGPRRYRLRRLVRHGAGVTGVAAQLCGDRKAVESLGYGVDPCGLIYETPAYPLAYTRTACQRKRPRHRLARVTVYRSPITLPRPAIAQRLPVRVVQEDADLLTHHENASKRLKTA